MDIKDIIKNELRVKCVTEEDYEKISRLIERLMLVQLLNIEKKDIDSSIKRKIQLKSGFTNSVYGIIGERTRIEAFGNVQLCVGDVVEVFNKNGQSIGLHCVCKNEEFPDGFVMGFGREIFVNGRGHSPYDWLIIKRSSYTEMTIGDIVGDIKYVSY